MSKTKRNAPCPCGSGKKYKKCCGSSNVIQINHQVYNDELDRLHGELVSFAFKNYKDLLVKQNNKYDLSFLEGAQKDAIISCINLWTILDVPVLEGGSTIASAFLAKNKSKIKHTRTKDTFAEWPNSTPSVYEVVSIDEADKKVNLKDLLSEENYKIPLMKEDNFENGDLLTGIVVPYIEQHNFFLTVLEIGRRQREKAMNLLSELASEESGLMKTYPDFLLGMLLRSPSKKTENSTEQHVWEKEEHEQVADLFKEHMTEKAASTEVTSIGIKLWTAYCKKENPNLKKPSIYAAALDYLVQNSVAKNGDATQKAIAKEYGTSPGTVSSNYRKLSSVLETEIQELTS